MLSNIYICIKESNASSILLYIKLPQLKECVKYFKDNKCMNLSVCDKILLKNTMKYGIWLVEKEFDSSPLHDNNIKTKIKIYNSRINANFHDK